MDPLNQIEKLLFHYARSIDPSAVYQIHFDINVTYGDWVMSAMDGHEIRQAPDPASEVEIPETPESPEEELRPKWVAEATLLSITEVKDSEGTPSPRVRKTWKSSGGDPVTTFGNLLGVIHNNLQGHVTAKKEEIAALEAAMLRVNIPQARLAGVCVEVSELEGRIPPETMDLGVLWQRGSEEVPRG